MVASGLDRDITEKEISGSLACDGLPAYHPPVRLSSGCLLQPERGTDRHDEGRQPLYHYDRGFLYDSLGLFPPIGAFFASLPDAVLGAVRS